MSDEEIVRLICRPEVLLALSTGLERFGAAQGVAEWLVTGAWLCTDSADFLVTASAEVLADGYVARRLAIATPAELAAQLKADVPDIAQRLRARGLDDDLPAAGVPAAPDVLSRWEADEYSTSVLLRKTERSAAASRVAAALLFSSGSTRLLVGADPSLLAIVLSKDPALIERYRAGCEELPISDYLAACTP